MGSSEIAQPILILRVVTVSQFSSSSFPVCPTCRSEMADTEDKKSITGSKASGGKGGSVTKLVKEINRSPAGTNEARIFMEQAVHVVLFTHTEQQCNQFVYH